MAAPADAPPSKALRTDGGPDEPMGKGGAKGQHVPAPNDAPACMAEMLEIMKRMEGTLNDLKPQLDDTKKDLAAMNQRVAALEEKAGASFADAMHSVDEDRMQKLDQKIAALQTQLDQLTTSPPASSASSSAGPAAGFSEVKTSNKCKVWILGFPRPMHARTMTQVGEDIKKAFPQDVSEGVSIKAYNTNKSFFMQFGTPGKATAFLDKARAEGLQYHDAVTGRNTVLRARPDLPLDVRRENRALGTLWSRFRKHMEDSQQWKEGMVLGSQPFKGVLYLIQGEVITSLFTVTLGDGDQVHVTIEDGILGQFGLDQAAVNKMIDITDL